jgi:hypothetical protein
MKRLKSKLYLGGAVLLAGFMTGWLIDLIF